MNETLADHRGLDIDRWLDAYSGGEPVGKAEVFSAVSDRLASLLPGYRYLRTKGTFHLSDETADQYIVLERGKGRRADERTPCGAMPLRAGQLRR